MSENPESVRMLAEWEEQEAVVVALPHEDTDWSYMLADALTCYRKLVEAIIDSGEKLILLVKDKCQATDFLDGLPLDNIVMMVLPTNDTWTRDYCVITVKDRTGLKAIDFGFNGWGLKYAADCDNLVNLRMVQNGIIDVEKYQNLRHFVCEGGSLETDGKGTLLTTTRCMCSPNRNGGMSKSELETVLKKVLGIRKILWLDHGYLAGDDTDSHIDTLARICPGNKILVTITHNQDDEHFEELTAMRIELEQMTDADGIPFDIYELPLPDPIYDEEDNRLPATYANYLVLNDRILLPVYSQPENDRIAENTIRMAYPDFEVVTVDCSALIRQHGSLHCSTMQIPKGLLNL